MHRPTKYRAEMAGIAEKLVNYGLTEQQIGDFLGVSPYTVWRWKIVYPEFAQAIDMTPERRLKIIENSVFVRATGYSHPAVKIFPPDAKGNPIVVPYTEHYPPDVGAQRLYLFNRDPKRWKNRLAPADDPAPPGEAAQEADRKRREAFAAMMAIIEERARAGLPPIFASNQPKPERPQITIEHRQEKPLTTPQQGNGKGNGKP